MSTMSTQYRKPAHADTTLSTLTMSPPESPIMGPVKDRNRGMFDLISTLALADAHGEGVDLDLAFDPIDSTTDTPAGSPTLGTRQLPSSQPSSPVPPGSAPIVDEKKTKVAADIHEGEEDDESDALGALPDQTKLDEHRVFRTPSSDASDLATRLAQLSVSNLARPPSLRSRSSYGEPTLVEEPDEMSLYPDDKDSEPTPEEKLDAIIDEFGPFEVGKCNIPERYVMEAKGGLFRQIVIIGNLHLTTHRISFHAYLPPPSLIDSSTNLTSGGGVLIKAGPVIVHRPSKGGIRRKPKRVWFELGPEMASTYPDATETGRTRPLKTILLSYIKDILPLDPQHPNIIEFTVTDNLVKPKLELDTVESALDWRREFEGALFHFRRLQMRSQTKAADEKNAALGKESSFGGSSEWERIRISIPLDRIIPGTDEIADYMNFSTLISMEVDLTEDLSASSMAAATASSSTLDQVNSLKIQFCMLSVHSPFIDKFITQLAAARKRRKEMPEGCSLPPMVEMDAIFKAEERMAAEQAETKVEVANGAGVASSGGDQTDHKLRIIFGLGDSEGLWSTPCGLQRTVIPLRGQLVVSRRYIGWHRAAKTGADISYRFSMADVKGAHKASTTHLSTHGLALSVTGHPDTLFEFFSKASRNEAIDKINYAVELYANSNHASPRLRHSAVSADTSSSMASSAGPGSPLKDRSRASSFSDHEEAPSSTRAKSSDVLTRDSAGLAKLNLPDQALNLLPKIVNLHFVDDVTDTREITSARSRRNISARHFCMLTIGSRGDVQPYIALSLGLMADGHRCTIITHKEFEKWITSYGIGYREAGGDPTALMKLSNEHAMFSPGFFKESLGHFRQWLDDLFSDSWASCQDADVLIESPSAMAGIHIAEALKIPYFRAFTMPWTRTHAYPQAFMVPPIEVSGNFNYATYVLFDNIIWKASSGQVNRWRQKELGLPPTDMSQMEPKNVPFVYNFSSAVVPKPVDWKDNIFISGYWNLENSDAEWSPPDDLDAFIKKARSDGRPLVYIGFGSIVVPHPAAMTRSIIKAVTKADVRAIIAKGWSARGGETDKDGHEIVIDFPANCYSIEKIPHSWLFSQIDAAVHHGGAGTTGASLRAGCPTIIRPWFGDQIFWAQRVQKLGAGIKLNSLTSTELSEALIKATTDTLMKETAARVGEKIRSEDGVGEAISFLYSYIERARDRHYKGPLKSLSMSEVQKDKSTSASPSSPSSLDSDKPEKGYSLGINSLSAVAIGAGRLSHFLSKKREQAAIKSDGDSSHHSDDGSNSKPQLQHSNGKRLE